MSQGECELLVGESGVACGRSHFLYTTLTSPDRWPRVERPIDGLVQFTCSGLCEHRIVNRTASIELHY